MTEAPETDDIALTREIRATVDNVVTLSRSVMAQIAESAYVDAADDAWLELRSERRAQFRGMELRGLRFIDVLPVFCVESAAHQWRRDGVVTAEKILGDLLDMRPQYVVENLETVARKHKT